MISSKPGEGGELTADLRFFAKVLKTSEDGCWLWAGAKYPSGYGQFRLDSETRIAAHGYLLGRHRATDGKRIRHLCHVKACVNPAHLTLLKLKRGTVNMQWSREHILECIQGFASEFGRPPSVCDWNPSMARRRGMHTRAELFYARNWPYYTTVSREFGKWSNAIREAGYVCNAGEAKHS